jgi:hypothetical protein
MSQVCVALVRIGGVRGIIPPSDALVAPRRTFHRVTSRSGGVVSGEFERLLDALDVEDLGWMGMDSRDVTIQPFAAARQCCRGGRSVRVRWIVSSSIGRSIMWK